MVKNYGGRKLGVTSSHRRALLRNMAASLFKHEKIETTLYKAKELRPFAEKLITDAKQGRHQRVRRHIHDKAVYRKLFDVLAPRYSTRSGGYTRVLRIGTRRGDDAQRGMIALLT